MTLEEAIKSVPYQVWLPDSALASNGSVSSVWVTGEEQAFEIAIEYESGVRVYLVSTPPPDPETHWKTLAEQLGPPVGVQTVHGVSAMVIPRDVSGKICTDSGCGPEDHNPSAVDLVLDAVQITVMGDYPVDQVIAAAESLVASKP